MTKPNEPTLTCSEVVERLAEIALDEATHFPGGGRTLHPFTVRSNIAAKLRAQAPAILHSWRERRVQELEEALRPMIDLAKRYRRHTPSPEAVNGLIRMAEDALAKSDEWREQIRKGAKHDPSS